MTDRLPDVTRPPEDSRRILVSLKSDLSDVQGDSQEERTRCLINSYRKSLLILLDVLQGISESESVDIKLQAPEGPDFYSVKAQFEAIRLRIQEMTKLITAVDALVEPSKSDVVKQLLEDAQSKRDQKNESPFLSFTTYGSNIPFINPEPDFPEGQHPSTLERYPKKDKSEEGEKSSEEENG